MTTNEVTKVQVRVRVIWNGKNFHKAVRNARRYDGEFDGESKTWTITLWSNHLETAGDDLAGYLRSSGLELVATQPRTVEWGDDPQGNESYWLAQQ